LKGAVPCGVAKGVRKGFSCAGVVVIIITEIIANRVFFINNFVTFAGNIRRAKIRFFAIPNKRL